MREILVPFAAPPGAAFTNLPRPPLPSLILMFVVHGFLYLMLLPLILVSWPDRLDLLTLPTRELNSASNTLAVAGADHPSFFFFFFFFFFLGSSLFRPSSFRPSFDAEFPLRAFPSSYMYGVFCLAHRNQERPPPPPPPSLPIEWFVFQHVCIRI